MRRFILTLIVMALNAIPTVAGAGQATPFATMADHYEGIRQALLHDSTKDVAGHARAIATEAASLIEATPSAGTDVPAASEAEGAALLPEIKKAAEALAVAADLATARDAFGELSKPMVRYRDMVSGDRPIVVYCPMAKKPWLQPKGEIGNPYYGQSMARCGEVVSE